MDDPTAWGLAALACFAISLALIVCSSIPKPEPKPVPSVSEFRDAFRYGDGAADDFRPLSPETAAAVAQAVREKAKVIRGRGFVEIVDDGLHGATPPAPRTPSPTAPSKPAKRIGAKKSSAKKAPSAKKSATSRKSAQKRVKRR